MLGGADFELRDRVWPSILLELYRWMGKREGASSSLPSVIIG